MPCTAQHAAHATVCLYRARAPVSEVLAAAQTGPCWQAAVAAAVGDASSATASPAYTQRLVTSALRAAVAEGEEVEEALAAVCQAALLAPPEALDAHGSPQLTRVFTYGPKGESAGSTLAITGSPNLLAGGTGCHVTWEAGLALAALGLSGGNTTPFSLTLPTHAACLRVLELGCGAGLATAAAARASPALQLLASDGDAAALAQAARNLAVNLGASHVTTHASVVAAVTAWEQPGVRLAPLRWGSLTAADAAAMRFDAVVGADLTYDPDLHAELLHCLATLLRHGGRGGVPPHVLLLSILRTDATAARFVAAAAAASLALCDVTDTVLAPEAAAGWRLQHLPAGSLPLERLRAYRVLAV